MRPWIRPTISNRSAHRPATAATWRIAHLSDIHVVGERYGFRIESGRSGPQGNDRLERVFAALETLHADDPLHAILITGDMTDAGLSTEWAEFFDAVARHTSLGHLIFMLPGNHDLNIVDRANPARLDLPTSTKQAAAQGARPDRDGRRPGRARSCRRSGTRPVGRHAGGRADAASRRHRGIRRRRAAPPDERAVGFVGPAVSHGAAAGTRGRPGAHPPQLECRHAFLVHQCAWHDLDRTGPRHRDRVPAVPEGMLGDRAASSSRGVSAGREGAVRTHRHGPDQRQLVSFAVCSRWPTGWC